jgi:predicted phosphodiesterase
MRIAVISDIHGNCLALETALGDIEKNRVDNTVCLGDTVQGGPQPAETIQRLRGLGCPVVMGNADAWLLDEKADTAEPITKEQKDVRKWTLSKLSPTDKAFIRGYGPTVEIRLGVAQRLLCFHGSPLSFDDILLPETPKERWDQLLGPFSPAVMTGGHTHTQQIRRVREGLFFNPGSIGVTYNRDLPEEDYHADSWAEYAILTWEDGRTDVEFKRAYYDAENLIRVIDASGRPHAERMVKEYRGAH